MTSEHHEPRVVVMIAPGSEEIEAVTVIDVLRRAGMAVTVASCSADCGLHITASRGVKLTADCHLNELADAGEDAIVLPGGLPGSECLRDTPALITRLRRHQQAGRWLAAICAAPAVVLAHHDLLGDARVTCHPGFQQQLPAAQRQTERVVIDRAHRLLTSQGPGTALEFSLALVALLCGRQRAETVAGPMVAGADIQQLLAQLRDDIP